MISRGRRSYDDRRRRESSRGAVNKEATEFRGGGYTSPDVTVSNLGDVAWTGPRWAVMLTVRTPQNHASGATSGFESLALWWRR